MIAPATIELKICQTLYQSVIDIHAAGLKGDGTWTNFIKRQLGQLGTAERFKVCTAGFRDDFDPAWLYDLIWYEEDEKGFLLDVPLAAESEWKEDFKEIKYDFEKLLAVKATHRLMICQSRTKYKEDRLQYFRDAVKAYRRSQPADRYLIALLDVVKEIFHFELIVLADPDTVESIPIPILQKAI
jgi:hypothetical protein